MPDYTTNNIIGCNREIFLCVKSPIDHKSILYNLKQKIFVSHCSQLAVWKHICQGILFSRNKKGLNADIISYKYNCSLANWLYSPFLIEVLCKAWITEELSSKIYRWESLKHSINFYNLEKNRNLFFILDYFCIHALTQAKWEHSVNKRLQNFLILEINKTVLCTEIVVDRFIFLKFIQILVISYKISSNFI